MAAPAEAHGKDHRAGRGPGAGRGRVDVAGAASGADDATDREKHRRTAVAGHAAVESYLIRRRVIELGRPRRARVAAACHEHPAVAEEGRRRMLARGRHAAARAHRPRAGSNSSALAWVPLREKPPTTRTRPSRSRVADAAEIADGIAAEVASWAD